MLAAERAEFYTTLAEALAVPPDWMSESGRNWPLYDLAAHVLPASPAVLSLASLPAESKSARRARYDALFGSGRPRYWLHESGFLNGRILGGATFDVARFYREKDVEVNGSELPDHASLELSFLAYLATQGYASTENHFLEEHASRWLPALGHSLASGGDPLYAALGQVLADFMDQLSVSPLPETRKTSCKVPVLESPQDCTLCGFCTQRCPTRALSIYETGLVTKLILSPEQCDGCEKCVSACIEGLLALSTNIAIEKPCILFESERMSCSKCGEPTVSRAEFNYLVTKIGHPAWLDLCLGCRVSVPNGGLL